MIAEIKHTIKYGNINLILVFDINVKCLQKMGYGEGEILSEEIFRVSSSFMS